MSYWFPLFAPPPLFPQHIKNNAETNKFEGWPDVLEMEGCIPQRQDWPELGSSRRPRPPHAMPDERLNTHGPASWDCRLHLPNRSGKPSRRGKERGASVKPERWSSDLSGSINVGGSEADHADLRLVVCVPGHFLCDARRLLLMLLRNCTVTHGNGFQGPQGRVSFFLFSALIALLIGLGSFRRERIFTGKIVINRVWGCLRYNVIKCTKFTVKCVNIHLENNLKDLKLMTILTII